MHACGKKTEIGTEGGQGRERDDRQRNVVVAQFLDGGKKASRLKSDDA